jgi:hypothetical protein
MPARKTDEYRRKAEECLTQAARIAKPEIKAMWLEMAQQWLMLADGAGKRRSQAQKPVNEPGQ